VKTSEQINDLAAASAKAQAAMRPAIKDSVNPAFKGAKYADLTAVWEACRKPLTDNGLTVWQDVTTADGSANGISVITRLVHSSGQWVEFGPLVVPLSKHDAHGVGSATSYGKRYALAAAIGVIAELDDDGNAAVEKSNGHDTAPNITEKQAADLKALIEEVGETEDRFIKWARIQTLGKLPASAYQNAVKKLEAKRGTAVQ
jgi:hypothetical protein